MKNHGKISKYKPKVARPELVSAIRDYARKIAGLALPKLLKLDHNMCMFGATSFEAGKYYQYLWSSKKIKPALPQRL